MLPLAFTLLAAALLAVSCEKVPLLAPTGSTITLISAASALPFNGSADIIAQVIEASGTPPHSGTKVSFTTNLGTLQPADAETDIAGRAVVRFLAGATSGTASITAISGGVTSAPTGSGDTATTGSVLKIAVGAAAVASVVMNASPSVVSASGGTSTITAKVADAGGNALAGIPVAFTTDAGSLSSSVATSDAAGSASVTLTTNRTAKVTGTAGVATTSGTATTTPSSTVTVTANATSTITIGTAFPASMTVGQTVSYPLTYTTGAGGSPVARVSVNWGDGRTQNYTGQPASIAHSFTSAGSYLIVVTATDTFGDSASASVALTVGPRPQPTVVVGVPDGATPNTVSKITITATPSTVSSSPIQSVAVDFGDGSQQTLLGNPGSVQHVYNASGTYVVSVIATDANGASGSGSGVIVIGGTTAAAFVVLPASPTKNNPASFNASSSTSSSPIVNYAWDFGDGSPGTSGSSPTQTHTYTAAATVTVTLTILDSVGRTATKQQLVTIVP